MAAWRLARLSDGLQYAQHPLILLAVITHCAPCTMLYALHPQISVTNKKVLNRASRASMIDC